MAVASAALARLRKLVARFPETTERLSHGAPTFWGGKKTFAMFLDDHHGDGRVAIWCKLPPGAQQDLVEADPVTFFVPPYVGPSGWVGIRVDRKPDWAVIEGLLEDGYRTVAPKRALARLDARPGSHRQDRGSKVGGRGIAPPTGRTRGR